MKKIQKDLQSRSFKLYYHINNSFLPKVTPTANIDLNLNFGNADFGLYGVYHVTFYLKSICSMYRKLRSEVFHRDEVLFCWNSTAICES